MFLLPQIYLEVKKTKLKGKGVFAKKDIEPGVVVADYLGTLIRADEEEAYEKKHGFYSMYYHKTASIFPDLTKDGAHLLNHSCAPNCSMYSYKGHTLYFSLRKIFKGEELTVSYFLSPLDDECNPCTHTCKCDSTVCTSTIHTNQKKYDQWVAYDDKKTKDIKLPRVMFGTPLKKLPSYPKQIPDHSIYTLYGCEAKKAASVSNRSIPNRKWLRVKIRETGRKLYFSKLGMTVLGISDDKIICQSKTNSV